MFFKVYLSSTLILLPVWRTFPSLAELHGSRWGRSQALAWVAAAKDWSCSLRPNALLHMSLSPMVACGARETYCCAVFKRPRVPIPSYHCRAATNRIPHIRNKKAFLVFPSGREELRCSQKTNAVCDKIKLVPWAKQCQLEEVLGQVLPVRIWRLCPCCLDAHWCNVVRIPDHILHG